MVGHGFHTKILAGPLITMDAGLNWPITAGFGNRDTNGDRRGSPGVLAAVIAVGRRYHLRPRLFTKVVRSPASSTSSLISALAFTISWMFVTSASRSCGRALSM